MTTANKQSVNIEKITKDILNQLIDYKLKEFIIDSKIQDSKIKIIIEAELIQEPSLNSYKEYITNKIYSFKKYITNMTSLSKNFILNNF